jgi:hypothetical protein
MIFYNNPFHYPEQSAPELFRIYGIPDSGAMPKVQYPGYLVYVKYKTNMCIHYHNIKTYQWRIATTIRGQIKPIFVRSGNWRIGKMVVENNVIN